MASASENGNPSPPVRPIEIFYSYADEDEQLFLKLQGHLEGPRTRSLITSWHHGLIEPGKNPRTETDSHLQIANIFILFASSSFTSFNQYQYEQTEIERRYNRDKDSVRIIPILLRPLDLTEYWFHEFRPLPRDGRAVTTWPEQQQDEVLRNIADEIKRIINAQIMRFSAQQPVTGRAAASDNTQPTMPVLTVPPSPTTTFGTRPAQQPIAGGTTITAGPGMGGTNAIPSPPFQPPVQPPAPPVQPQPQEHVLIRFLKRFAVPISVILAIALLCSAGLNVFLLYRLSQQQVPNPSTPYYGSNGIGTEQITVDGSPLRIGIIDGHSSTSFNQPTYNPLSCEENSYNESCIENDIFTANKNIGKAPYFTLIVVTTLDQSASDQQLSLRVGLDDLSGAYMAQQDNNKDSKIKLRLLIANLGTKGAATQTVQELVPQILQAASYDKSIVGIEGFPFSQSAQNALNMPQHLLSTLPVVSPTASSTELSDYTNFYRIVAPDSEQGPGISAFIRQNLPFNHMAVFYDPGDAHHLKDAYSYTLGKSVLDTIGGDAERYIVGQPATLSAGVKDVQNKGDDLIFFAGYADDLNALKTLLKQRGLQNIRIVGGEGLYDLGGYTGNNYANLYFTVYAAYAALDPRLNFIHCKVCPTFKSEYLKDFDPQNMFPGQYGHSLPGSHVLQTYDAITAFLQAASRSSGVPTRADMISHLPGTAFDGVSGHIQFVNQSSDPFNKILYIACTNSSGDTQVLTRYTPVTTKGQDPFPDKYSLKECQ